MRSILLLLLCPVIVTAQINPVYIFKSNLSYSKLESASEGIFGFEKDDKFGYMDKNGNVLIPAVYSYENTTNKSIPYFTNGYAVIKKDGKSGLLDKTGKIAIPFEYASLYVSQSLPNYVIASKKDGSKTLYGLLTTQNKPAVPFEYEDLRVDSNLIMIKQNNKWGLVDKSGKLLLPAEYSALNTFPKDNVLKAEIDGKYGFIDPSGKWLFEKAKSVYTLYSCSQGMVLCTVSGKYGFLDLKGNEVIITKYDNAYGFENMGLAKAGKKISSSSNYQYGFIDKKGYEVIPLKYESIGSFSNGLVSAKDPETNRYGYLDKTGKWAIKPIFVEALAFDVHGGAWVKMTDAKYHYINKAGKDFGAFDATSYKSFNKEGFALFEHSDYPYVLIDKNGKVIKQIEDCDGIYLFSDGVAGYKSKSNNKYGFLDQNGNKIVPCEYDGFTGFTEGIAKVEKKSDGKTKAGYIDSKGNVILPILYETAGSFRNGWGLIKKDTSYFFVDRSGNLKEPPRKYDELYEFRSGYALGKIKGVDKKSHSYYFINTQLKEEFSVSAWQAYLFWENVAVVSRDDNTYELMNKKGEIFKKLDGIETLKFCADGMLAVKEKGKWGFINDKGDMVVKARYDSCESFKYSYGKIKMGSKWGIIDKSGTEIIEPKYENILPGENGIFIFFEKYWGVMDKTGKILVPPGYLTVNPFEKDKTLARLGKSYTILKSPLVK